jgi:hypothetical protein
MNKCVNIGEEVLIFHVFTESFVKATREKNPFITNLFYLKLSQSLSSGTHFTIRINPYLNFKKEGERISYEDSFYFENVKFRSMITSKNLNKIITNNNEKADKKSEIIVSSNKDNQKKQKL